LDSYGADDMSNPPAGTTSGDKQETSLCTLCFTPECRKVFDYRKVPWHKRCTGPKCTSDFPNCGCSVTVCGVCHQILCSLHLPSHYRDCIQTAPRRCGYLAQKNGMLYPEFCKHVLVGDRVQQLCFCCNSNAVVVAAIVVAVVRNFGASRATKSRTTLTPTCYVATSCQLEMPPCGVQGAIQCGALKNFIPRVLFGNRGVSII
jgi:hypothetical protein